MVDLILRSTSDLVIGMPVLLEIFCFACMIPFISKITQYFAGFNLEIWILFKSLLRAFSSVYDLFFFIITWN